MEKKQKRTDSGSDISIISLFIISMQIFFPPSNTVADVFDFFWPDLWPQCRKKCQTPLSRLSGQSCVLLPGFGVQSQITMANWRLFFIGNGIGLELKRGIF